ncbi:hypothetical protein [Providencia sp. PROV271]|uniref:hypothetical protein n=1 Tax=Providencia sp. PROV271 TaxID=2949959 RepID=UPI00234A656B|nr:hypothetical protein [Providencia sp. PROV271]
MAKPRKGKKKDDRERAKTSREKRKEDLGAPFTINMHDKNKKRLREICVHFGHDGMMEREKGTGRIFSQTIMNVVDFYYITSIIKPKNRRVTFLIDAFKAIWKEVSSQKNLVFSRNDFDSLKKKEKKIVKEELESIANEMSKSKYPSPPYLFNNSINQENKYIWTANDVLDLLNIQFVINKIKEMEKLKK